MIPCGRLLFATLVLLLSSGLLCATDPAILQTYIDRGFTAEKLDDYDKALTNFSAAVRQFPNSPDAYYYRGGFYIRRDSCELALKDFDTALRLKPSWWWAANARGAVYAAMGRYDLALADYNRVLSLNPQGDIRAVISNNRARIEATCPDPKFRNGQKALEDAKKASSYGHWKATHLVTLAAAYAEIGDFDSAIKYQERAMAGATDGDNLFNADVCLALYKRHKPYREEPICGPGKKHKPPEDRKHVATFLTRKAFDSMNKGDETTWRRNCDAAIRADPTMWFAYYYRGLLFRRQHNWQSALRDLDTAMRLNPTHLMISVMRADINLHRGRYDLSLTEINQVFGQNPGKFEIPILLNDRAWILATSPDASFRDGKRAVADATRACALTRRKRSDCLDTLAVAHAEAGDFDSAIRYEKIAIGLASKEESPDMQRHLALLQQRRPIRGTP